MKSVAQYLPARVRLGVYTVLGLAVGLEMIWDLVPGPLEGKILASLTVFGFGLAAANTKD